VHIQRQIQSVMHEVAYVRPESDRRNPTIQFPLLFIGRYKPAFPPTFFDLLSKIVPHVWFLLPTFPQSRTDNNIFTKMFTYFGCTPN